MVDRYRHSYNAHMRGREDVWATDRIQAPGAWNLIERFIGRSNLNHVKVAVLDSGCDQTHPEFNGVALRKVVINNKAVVRIAGREDVLPLPTSYDDSQAYNLGDPSGTQHGTGVTSLIGACKGFVIDATHQDRGLNGLLHNPMLYTIQVYRYYTDMRESGDTTYGVTGWLAAINVAALTDAKIMNASLGVHVDSSQSTPAALRVALRKVAHQLNLFRNKILLVVAAGNEGDLVHPFEDLNLNNQLDAGEDANGNGQLDFGNDMAGSLGLLPNVIAVGAIGGIDHDAGPAFNWARDDQRAHFSNWGVSVQIAAPGVDVFTSGKGDFQIGGARFARSTGTSFAAPLTAGSAALLKAIAPNLTPQQMKNYLLDAAFEVNTTDGEGNPLTWKTLKTGYAVRQLMVDRRIINNDQPWTGVSKVIYGGQGLRMFEVRRGPNGRAEAFAHRAVLNLSVAYPALSHNEITVIWMEDSRTIRQYNFAMGASGTLITLSSDRELESGLETTPDNRYVYGVRILDGSCNRTIEVFVGLTKIAYTNPYSICPFGLFGAQDWEDYSLYKSAWRPDNRTWALDYFFWRGNGNTQLQQCRAWWGGNPYPAAPLLFPGCTAFEFRYPAWSPDGRAYAGVVGDARLDIAYYNTAHQHQFTRSGGVGTASVQWLHWSPDGSELGYLGHAGIATVRRDIRNTADRSPLLLLGDVNREFTWQW